MYNPVKLAHSAAMADQPLLLNSITDADEAARGRVAVCGSHGGIYPAYLASLAGLRAVVFNDAGGGLDNAGIAGVMALADVGVAAVAASHQSCRIGDAGDMARRGLISAVNALAGRLGVTVGEAVGPACDKLAGAQMPCGMLAELDEARRVLRREAGRDIVLVDSASLVKPEDAGRIVITGSHGGLIGGDPVRALKADAFLAVFNDAGGGCDDAGLTRLAALDARGIAALTVAHVSARIGDAGSSYDDGIISAVNNRAARLNLKQGGRLRAALARL